MKKIYLLSALLSLTASVCGQQFRSISAFAGKHHSIKEQNIVEVFKNNPSSPAPQAVIWSEDFANGIPATWTNTGVSSTAAIWVYRGPNTTPNNNIGGQGDCSTGTPIQSPTKANGFIIFDSNDYDPTENCNPNDANTGTAAPPHTATLETNSIDLSLDSNIVLKFYYYGRNYQATPSVSVSGDNGLSYTEVWTWPLSTNAASANAQLVSVNISSIAGGKNNVKIKITWDGNYYELMMDDFSIEHAPAFDLTLKEKFYYTSPLFDSTSTRYYTRIPLRQALVDTLSFGAYILNNGGTAQQNVKLTVNVSGVQSGTYISLPDSLPVATWDSLSTTAQMTFSAKGNYFISWSAGSDSTDAYPSDNLKKDTILVTDTVYARDNNKPSTGSWYGTSGETYIIGNLFKMGETEEITSMSVYILNSQWPFSQVGKTINFKLYDLNSGDFIEMASNDFHIIESNEVGKWLTLSLFPVDPYTSLILNPGWYVAAFESQSDSLLATTGAGSPAAPIQTTFVSVSDQPGVWGYASVIPFIRLNTLKSTIAVGNKEEKDQNSLSVFPNPGNGLFNVQVAKKGVYYFEVMNILGQPVFANNCFLNDNGRKSINLSALGKGIYFLQISGNGVNQVQKLIVK